MSSSSAGEDKDGAIVKHILLKKFDAYRKIARIL